jgi:cell division protein FtsZ
MTNLDFDMPQNQASTIKVIGVGGGGSNAVNYMYVNGIRGVDFVVCNTDQQALDDSPVPNKIQLGVSATKGLGAGADPLRGKSAAEENIKDVIAVLENNTEMVFINAGMGGGTGTGAAPVIAKAAKDMDILTVAIVTIPFEFEGGLRNAQAREGIEELKKHVDSLIVINNNKLREIYGKLGFKSGFAKADEILATASRGIAEVITQTGHLNIDLNDARTVLSNSGTAIMGTGTASGEGRAIMAVKGAIESPLLDNNHIRGAKKVLLLIVSGSEEVTFEEMGEISDFIQDQVTVEGGAPADIIMGVAEDEALGDAINVTVVATGFHEGKAVNPVTGIPEVVKHDLEENLVRSPVNVPLTNSFATPTDIPLVSEVRHRLEDKVVKTNTILDPIVKEEMIPQQFIETEVQEDLKQVSLTFEYGPDEPQIELQGSQIQDIEFPVKTIAESHECNVDTQEAPFLSVNETEKIEDEVTFNLSNDEEFDETENTVDERVVFTLDEEPNIIPSTSVDCNEPEVVKPTQNLNQEPLLTTRPISITVDSDINQITEVETEVINELVETIEDELSLENTIDDQLIKSVEQSTVTLSTHSDTVQEQIERAQKRKDRLQKFNYQFRNNSVINKAESEPAYKRQGVQLNDELHSTDEPLSRMSLSTNETGKIELKSRNSFLHDNVD